MPPPPNNQGAPYRERLRVEGGVLAGAGAIATAAILTLAASATDHAVSTAVQLLVVLVLMLTLGSATTRRAMARAQATAPAAIGSGEPTPLWQLPLIVAVLAVAFGTLAGWDAGLRIGGGCIVVGLIQAIVLERVVAADEARHNRCFYRLRGSRILRGTRLGHLSGSEQR